jgi:hypothetical protein
MQLVKIQILGRKVTAKPLVEMSGQHPIMCFPNEVYVVPEPVLDFLNVRGVAFREFDREPRNPAKEFCDDIHQRMIESLEEYSGKLVVRKLSCSESIAIQHLCHPRPKYRYAALCLLEWKWQLTQDVADLCEDLALSDPDLHVRHAAVMNLSAYYMRSGNMRIGNLLATIVYNEKEDMRVREGAYRVLFGLSEEFEWNRPPLFDFRFPADVDWAFVDSFVRQGTFARIFRRFCHFLARNPFTRSKSAQIGIPNR